MTYSLSNKITRYLESKGVKGARIQESIIAIPTENGGEMHRKITGLITTAKLDAIIAEYRSTGNDAA